MDDVDNPLTARHKGDCDRCLTDLHRALSLIERYERTGQDVGEIRRAAEHLRDRLEAYKREFFPQER
jgi:hypothetical protein